MRKPSPVVPLVASTTSCSADVSAQTELKAAFAAHGLAAAESYVRLCVSRPAQRAQLFFWLGKRMAASSPAEAARLGMEAWNEQPDPELGKWLMFRQFNAGNLTTALKFLDSIQVGSLRPSERRKAALILQLGQLQQSLPMVEAAVSPASIDPGSVLYIEPRRAGWSGQTTSAQVNTFVLALRDAGAGQVTSLRLENLIASPDGKGPSRKSDSLGEHAAERVVVYLDNAIDGLDQRILAAATVVATEAARVRAGVIHSARPLLGALAARLAAHMLGVAFVYDATDIDDGPLETAAEGSSLHALAARIEAAVTHDASLVLAPNRAVMQERIRLGAPAVRSMVVQRLVPTVAITAERRKSRLDLQLAGSDMVFGCLEMTVPDEHVFLAFAEISRSYPEAKLLLVANAAIFGSIRQLATQLGMLERIIFREAATPAENRL